MQFYGKQPALTMEPLVNLVSLFARATAWPRMGADLGEDGAGSPLAKERGTVLLGVGRGSYGTGCTC